MENPKKEFAQRIIRAIEKGEVKNAKELNTAKLRIGKELSVSELPSNPDVLSFAQKPGEKTKKLLSIKPLRTLSGVAPVAIMTKPIKCPHGTCLYCPGGPKSFFGNVPQSYTGSEPATMRAINNGYDAYSQTMNRISQYYATAHFPEKLELIIMGGTFPSFEKKYQCEFVTGAFQAANDFSEMFLGKKVFDAKKFNKFFSQEKWGAKKEPPANRKKTTLEKEHAKNEKARIRIVTMCIETKPDWSRERHINQMLNLGATRVELGAQTVYDEILKYTNRGHTIEDTIDATRLLKDAGLKVTYHLMPGQPLSNREKDIQMFKEIFENPDYKPDGLKIYPCMVMPGTGLQKLYEQGQFKPLTTEEASEIIAEANRFFPKYTRIYRVQRDIPTKLALAGIDKNNLRQIAEQKMIEKKITQKEIRSHESGISTMSGKKVNNAKVELKELSYEASKGEEVFISFEDTENDILLGFCRLRNPFAPFRKEFTENTAAIRELHVFGQQLGLGKHGESEQHKGLGQKLVKMAEEIAKEKFDAKKMLIISGVGAREYYSKKLGYRKDGVYMAKKI